MMGAVVLTASAGSFPGLITTLRSRGIEVVDRPLIGFASPSDWGLVDRALGRLAEYPTVAATSPRAGKAMVERARVLGVEPPRRRPVVWAAGAASAVPLAGWLGQPRIPAATPDRTEGAAAALARAMVAEKTVGPVLFPCGDLRRDELPGLLREAGVEVDEVVCYRTVLSSEADARAAAASGGLLVVASPSVMGLLAQACPPVVRPALLAVGPTTASAAGNAGWTPAAVAEAPTSEGVLGAIAGLLTAR
jgi:uroporphyrinogen-III synthase